VVPYSTLEHRWKPREGFRNAPPREAVGKYLERPYLHYTVGTRVTPSMMREFDHFGVKKVDIHDNPPPFQPEMIRGMYTLQHDPDWMTRMYGSGLKGGLLQAAHRGGTSKEMGTSFVPSLAKGTEFGRAGLIHAPEMTTKISEDETDDRRLYHGELFTGETIQDVPDTAEIAQGSEEMSESLIPEDTDSLLKGGTDAWNFGIARKSPTPVQVPASAVAAGNRYAAAARPAPAPAPAPAPTTPQTPSPLDAMARLYQVQNAPTAPSAPTPTTAPPRPRGPAAISPYVHAKETPFGPRVKSLGAGAKSEHGGSPSARYGGLPGEEGKSWLSYIDPVEMAKMQVTTAPGQSGISHGITNWLKNRGTQAAKHIMARAPAASVLQTMGGMPAWMMNWDPAARDTIRNQARVDFLNKNWVLPSAEELSNFMTTTDRGGSWGISPYEFRQSAGELQNPAMALAGTAVGAPVLRGAGSLLGRLARLIPGTRNWKWLRRLARPTTLARGAKAGAKFGRASLALAPIIDAITEGHSSWTRGQELTRDALVKKFERDPSKKAMEDAFGYGISSMPAGFHSRSDDIMQRSSDWKSPLGYLGRSAQNIGNLWQNFYGYGRALADTPGVVAHSMRGRSARAAKREEMQPMFAEETEANAQVAPILERYRTDYNRGRMMLQDKQTGRWWRYGDGTQEQGYAPPAVAKAHKYAVSVNERGRIANELNALMDRDDGADPAVTAAVDRKLKEYEQHSDWADKLEDEAVAVGGVKPSSEYMRRHPGYEWSGTINAPADEQVSQEEWEANARKRSGIQQKRQVTPAPSGWGTMMHYYSDPSRR
jgi:hypothetical protein